MSLDDYTEKFYTDGYKQQIADEENVPRSLPFFATASAVLVAIIAASKDLIPGFSWTVYSAWIWALIALLALCLLASMILLLFALWPRDFKYVMSEPELHNYVEQLRKFYSLNSTLSASQREAAILEDLRIALSSQYRVGAANNRAINFGRASKRATAFCLLVFALILAFAMIASILVNIKIEGASNAGRQGENRGSAPADTGSRSAGEFPPKAASPTSPDNKKGRMD